MEDKIGKAKSDNNKLMLDILFKIAVIILGIIYLVLYYNQSLNNRYKIVDKSEQYIFDTKKGIYYQFSKGKIVFLDMINGKIGSIEVKSD